MKAYDGYTVRRLLRGHLLVFVVLAALFGLTTLVDELGDVGRGRYRWSDALFYVALTLPYRMLDLVPVIGLLGSILSLGSMAATNELLAMRALGISAWRILASSLKAGMILVGVALLVAEYVAPPLALSARTRRSFAIHEPEALQLERGFWFREGNSFVKVGRVLHGRQLADVSIYEIGPDARLRSWTRAARAEVLETGEWILQDVRRDLLGEGGLDSVAEETERWQAEFGPTLLRLNVLTPENLSVSDLALYVKNMRKHGQSNEPHRIRLWRILALPLLVGSMIFLAVPFVFVLRDTSSGRRMTLGCLVGAAAYALDRIGAHAGVLSGLNPVVIALAPGILTLAVGVFLMRRKA